MASGSPARQENFEVFQQKFPEMPIIAEDLGVITPDVKDMRDSFNLPGMKILQFGFTGDPEDDFLPHHYPVNCFAYTGSHDNNTARVGTIKPQHANKIFAGDI